jgi:hypothetical protein
MDGLCRVSQSRRLWVSFSRVFFTSRGRERVVEEREGERNREGGGKREGGREGGREGETKETQITFLSLFFLKCAE